jgi:hypothetical protein
MINWDIIEEIPEGKLIKYGYKNVMIISGDDIDGNFYRKLLFRSINNEEFVIENDENINNFFENIKKEE